MQDIHRIYHNSYGISFQWKRNRLEDLMKVQIIFKDTGLLLSKEELTLFSNNIRHTKETYSLCNDCVHNDSCKGLLIEAPLPHITFAVNTKELKGIQDLVEGTLFHMNLNNFLGEICNNN